MPNQFVTILFIAIVFSSMIVVKPVEQAKDPKSTEIDFISDTQQPMWVEKILLRPNHNISATALIFADILKQKPHDLYMLGDIVALGYKNSKWTAVDHFLDHCHKEGIQTHGLLGNHDVMGKLSKGETNFQKRFPEYIRTGYVSVVCIRSRFHRHRSVKL